MALAGASSLLVALAGTPASSGCGSSDAGLCGARGHCAMDMPRSQSMLDDCNALLGDPACGSRYQAALQCLSDHEQCDAAGNVDATATLQACAGPYDDWAACTRGSGVDAGGG